MNRTLRDRTVRIDDHQHEQRNEEDDREDDRDAVKILLNDARSRLRGVHRTRNHIGNAGALAGMQQDENDQANT